MNKKTFNGMDMAALALLVAASSPAYSQAQAQATDKPAETAGDAGIVEVIVTANRREQSLSKTPMSITAISGDKLASDGVVNTQSLTNILPNVQNGPAGFSIRGVASGDFTEKGDPSTAFNLDGIYIARFTEQALALFDIERVEVLRGPQGTLYGRNATAGVVNVITAKPTDTFDASGTLEAGNFGTIRSTAMVNIPVSDSVALRLASATNKHDGYTPTHDGHRSLDDQDDVAFRAKLLAKFGGGSDLLLSADYAKTNTVGAASVAQPRVFAVNDDTGLRYQNPGIDNFNRFKATGFSAEFNSDLGFAKLTYLFGYRESTWRALATKGDAIANITSSQDHRQDSHELRLASQGAGALQYVAGLYYFHENSATRPALDITGLGLLSYDLNATSRSYAPFGQVTYAVSPTLRLTGGARYTEDEKARSGTFKFTTFPASPYDAAYKGSKASWKAGVETDLTDKLLAYASISTGYKAGGFNDGNPASQPALYYGPETLTSYEGGVKGSLLNRTLYFSASAFYYDYKGLQLGTVLPVGGQVTSNAGKSTVTGLELEGSWKPGRDTTFNYNLALLNAKYDSYLPQGASGPSYAGRPLDRSPKFSGRLGVTQNFPLENGARIAANASVKYSGSYVVSDFNVPVQYVQKSYTRTDVTLSYYAAGGGWFVQAFGRNLENKRLLGQVEFGSFSLSEPAQYGVRAGVYF